MFNRSKNTENVGSKQPLNTSVPKHTSGNHFAHNVQKNTATNVSTINNKIDSHKATSAGAHNASQSYLRETLPVATKGPSHQAKRVSADQTAKIQVPVATSSQRTNNTVVQPIAVQPVNPYQESNRKADKRGNNARQKGGASMKDPTPKKFDFVSTFLMVVGVVLLLVAGGMFAKIYHGYHDARATYDDLEQYLDLSDLEHDLPVVDFEELAKINPDIVAWIYVPNTNINYPVCSTDDNQKYLHTLFDGTPNDSGSIFMDMDDPAPGLQAPQTTLYGHHMLSGQMFNVVDAATGSQEEFDKIEKAYYITPETTYVLTPILTARVSPDDAEVRDPYLEEVTLQGYLDRLYGIAHSVTPKTEQRIGSAEKILTLVTCNYDLSTKQRSIMVFGLDTQVNQDDIESYSSGD